MKIKPEFQDIFTSEKTLVGGLGSCIKCLRTEHNITNVKKKKKRKTYSFDDKQ